MKKTYEHLLVRLWGRAYASTPQYRQWQTDVEDKRGAGFAEADLRDRLREMHKDSSPRAGTGAW